MWCRFRDRAITQRLALHTQLAWAARDGVRQGVKASAIERWDHAGLGNPDTPSFRRERTNRSKQIIRRPRKFPPPPHRPPPWLYLLVRKQRNGLVISARCSPEPGTARWSTIRDALTPTGEEEPFETAVPWCRLHLDARQLRRGEVTGREVQVSRHHPPKHCIPQELQPLIVCSTAIVRHRSPHEGGMEGGDGGRGTGIIYPRARGPLARHKQSHTAALAEIPPLRIPCSSGAVSTAFILEDVSVPGTVTWNIQGKFREAPRLTWVGISGGRGPPIPRKDARGLFSCQGYRRSRVAVRP